MLSQNRFIKSLPLKKRIFFFKRYLELILPTHFAHHPLCDNFKQEILSLKILTKNFYICRGCFWVFLSMILSFSVLIIMNPFRNQTAIEKFIIVILVSSPTWIGVLFSFKYRIWKDLLRISLGTGFGIALGELILTPNFFLKILIAGFIFVFIWTFSYFRKRFSRGKSQIICLDCEKMNTGICEGFKQQIDAQRQYSQELSNYIQENSSWVDIKQKLSRKRY
ncbi:MAG: hypothetical protein EAX86_11140 [Candidatus Heimdallarchaeota archaeon]|nr:hypothetical protein [Candidatus Heimdallarchaeota archaeon]